MPASWRRSTRRSRKGRGRRGDACASILSGPSLDEAITALGHMPLPPYIASKRPDDERDRRDYQTIYRRARRRRRRADRRPAFHAGAVGAPRRARHRPRISSPCMSAPAPSCRSRPTTPRDHRMHAEWGEIAAGDRDCPQRGAPARRAHRRRRHDLAAPARERRGARRGHRSPSPARRRSSSRRATASAPSTC